jgi:ribonuclease T1
MNLITVINIRIFSDEKSSEYTATTEINYDIAVLISSYVKLMTNTSKKEKETKTKRKTDKIDNDYQTNKQNKIPHKVYEVLKYVKENGTAPDGYVGGRKFGNYEKQLPQKDENGLQINYFEWDVNPKQKGRNRGAERLVTGSNAKAYFTKNHYKSFIEIE